MIMLLRKVVCNLSKNRYTFDPNRFMIDDILDLVKEKKKKMKKDKKKKKSKK